MPDTPPVVQGSGAGRPTVGIGQGLAGRNAPAAVTSGHEVAMSVESRPRGGPDLDRAREADAPSAAPHGGARGDRRTGRIPGLDGLRALAVTAVIAYHLFPDQLPGGFLGVDVFFVV